MVRMPMHFLHGAILHGGVGITTPGIGITVGTGTSVMEAGDLAGDGMILGIIITTIIIIGAITHITTTITDLSGQVVADTSVAVGAMGSIMITVVVLQTGPMQFVAIVVKIIPYALPVVMTVAQ